MISLLDFRAPESMQAFIDAISGGNMAKKTVGDTFTVTTEHRRITPAGLEREAEETQAEFRRARNKRTNVISMIDRQLKALTNLRQKVMDI